MILSALLFKAILVAVLSFLDNWHADACSVPKIREKEGNEIKIIEVTSGREVKLTCQIRTVGQTSQPRYYWLKDNQTLSPSNLHRMRLKLYRYLKIKIAKKEDAGFYTCVAVNDCGENSFTMHLFVGSPTLNPNKITVGAAPRFTVSQNKMRRNLLQVPVGNSVKLDCSADGNPRPTVKWYKDGNLFKERRSGHKLSLSPWTTLLSLKDLVPSDTGSYMCNVSNSYGWINHTYKVDVYERAHAKPVILPMENVTVYRGENASLTCKALSDSMPHFQWLRWFPVRSNGSAHSSVNGSIESPHYEIVNKEDADQHVIVPPRSGKKFDFHGVNLTLLNVTKRDEGKYTCIVGNAVDYAFEHAYIIVQNIAVKPHFLYPDKMAKDTAKLEYTEEDKFQLQCDAKGTPTPTVTWYRGKEIYRGSRSDETITPGRYHYTIYFNGVDVKDAGNYTCVVKNSYGTLTHSYVFEVKEKIRSAPQILSIWEQKKPEYAGTDLQMHAIVLSKDENTKFFWYFSKSFVSDETNLGTLINQTLSESRLETPPGSGVSWLKWKLVLNLKNLSVADSGSYWCQAENIVGTVKRQTPLNVTTRPITPSPSEAKICQANQFTCADKSCISLFRKCDGRNDCHDKSDENGCPTTAPLVCSKGMFRCDGDCIQGHLQCDGKNDCSDGFDERGCDPTASPTNVSRGEKTRDALVPGIVSAGVLITVAALSFICWRSRSRTKEPVNDSISMLELEFEYDAFVIFSSQDSDWVTKTLIPTLEEKHGFKCCVHYRDFVVGVPFRENMVNSVYKSRKTIAVVSNNFFNSNYCGSEMDYALQRHMARKDNSLVVIKLDDVGRGKLPKELRKRSFIDLSKNVEKEHWERKLVQCLTIPRDLSQEQIL